MNEIQQQRHDALTAHRLEAAERAVAHQLNALPEGATPEFAAAADLLGCRAPGETAATGTSKRADGHIDTWRRALPKLADDKIIRFTTPVELVQGGRQHGWLAAGTRDTLPGWAWNDELVNNAAAAQWAQRFDFAERVMADERVGYTAGADAVMLAAHADSTGTLHGQTMFELRELTGRSRNAVERSLEILERAGYATVLRDERVRPMLHTITLRLRGNQADAPSPAPAVAAVAEPAPTPKEEVWDFTETQTPQPEAVAEPDDLVIELAPPKPLFFPQHVERFLDKAEETFGQRFTSDTRREILKAAAEYEERCWWQERFIDELWRLAYEALVWRYYRMEILTSASASLPVIDGIIRNQGYERKAKKEIGGATPAEARQLALANRAYAQAQETLRRMRDLVQYGDEARDDPATAMRLLHDELLPLAPAIAPLCDHDIAYAEAQLRLAWKQDQQLSLHADPDEYARDLDPSWTWPASIPTARERERRAELVREWRKRFTDTHWRDERRAEILDELDMQLYLAYPEFVEWLRTDDGAASLRAGLKTSPYRDFRNEWDALFAAAGVDKRAFVQEAA